MGADVQFKPDITPRFATTSQFSPKIKEDWAVAFVNKVWYSQACVPAVVPAAEAVPPADNTQYRDGTIELWNMVELKAPTAICSSLNDCDGLTRGFIGTCG